MLEEGRGGRYRCTAAGFGYVYDPEKGDLKGGIPPGTRFEDLPQGWRCPACGAGKAMFQPLETTDEARGGGPARERGA
jgi:rubredoxin